MAEHSRHNAYRTEEDEGLHGVEAHKAILSLQQQEDQATYPAEVARCLLEHTSRQRTIHRSINSMDSRYHRQATGEKGIRFLLANSPGWRVH